MEGGTSVQHLHNCLLFILLYPYFTVCLFVLYLIYHHFNLFILSFNNKSICCLYLYVLYFDWFEMCCINKVLLIIGTRQSCSATLTLSPCHET